MATTEIDKVPATIQSRSQVFELKTIGVRQIADQLRAIAAAEGITIDDAALMLVARAGDGSMRDAQSAFDQVIAFAGTTITADDVTAVLGLVRRDMLFDIAEAVAREDAAAGFELAGQAVETGYELRSVVRELARLTRDLVLVKIDASRANDPEIAAEGERDRMLAVAAQFSNEDLMRAFDLLTKAEFDIRGSAHPRYHLEMALLRWIHLRKLVPLSDLLQGVESRPGPGIPPAGAAPRAAPARPAPAPAPRPPAQSSATVRAVEARRQAPPPPVEREAPQADAPPVNAGQLKDAFLEEVRKVKKFFHGTVVAQAQRIEQDGDRIVFTFGPHHKALRAQFEQNRPLLEDVASRLAGRRMAVVTVEGTAAAPPRADAPRPAQTSERQEQLKQQALEDSGVQAMLDVFAAEIKDVEER
jgi:DNA polymerase-3 subunit gamma/tau